MRNKLGKGLRAVLDLIDMNPDATAESISAALGITVSAAKKRIQRLIQVGAVSERFSVRTEFSKYSAKAHVSMTTSNTKLERKKSFGYRGLHEFTSFLTNELSKTREWMDFFTAKKTGAVVVRRAYSVAGAGMGTDVILVLEGTGEILIRDFVTEVVTKLDGVVQTNTAAIVYFGNRESY